MKSFKYLLATAVFFMLAGCVSKPIEEENSELPPLMIAQNGDGDVTIQWETEPGHVYTIYYQATTESDWKILRGANRLPGTGELLTARDRVNPNRPLRRYRVLPEKQEL